MEGLLRFKCFLFKVHFIVAFINLVLRLEMVKGMRLEYSGNTLET